MYRSLAMDVNGDGQMDFVQPDGSGSELQVWIRQGVKPFLLRSATDAMGARVEFDYAPLTDTAMYTRGQGCIYPQPCVRQGMWLVSELRTEAGPFHPMRRVSYQYEDARLDALGKGLLGIRKRTVTDHASGSVSRETYALAPLVGKRYPLARQLLNRTVRTPLSNGRTWIRETVATPAYVERTAADGTRYFSVYTASKTERAFELGLPVLWSVTRTVEDFDADFGNVKAEKWVWSDGYVSRRDTAYENRVPTWQVGLPSRITETATTAQGLSRTRIRSFVHAPGSGLLTDEVTEPDSTDPDVYLATHYDYTPDGMGLRGGVTLRALSGATRTTSYEYDSATKTTVSAITNPAGHRQMMAYHPGLGVLAATVDANGVRQRWQYDAFGRLRVEDGPTLADVSYEYLPGRIRTARAGGSEETVFLDSLGRAVTRQRQDFAGNLAEENYFYSAAGRLVEVQRPSPSGETAVARTRYQYDELGRLTRLTQPDDTFQTLAYAGLTLTETDARGNATTTELNGRGWAMKVSEPNPAGGVLNTTFEYGPFGTVTGTESVGRHASMEYDVRGRRTRLSDPSNGVSVTHYNAFGDTRLVEDAEGEQQVFMRDSLGRTTSVITLLGETTYSWDTAVNGVGALAGTASADGVSTAYVYDTLSRRSKETTQVAGSLYSFDYTYDAYGRLKTVAYPEIGGTSRLQVQYGYTPRGDLLDVRNVASQLVYWQVGARTASGHLSHAVLGNGTESHYRYDNVGALRLVETGSGTSNLQRLLFNYDANGNLTERNDGVAESTEEFGYDGLDRLTRWTVYQNCQRAIFEYGFSSDGNLTGRTTVEGSAPGESYVYGQNGAPPHAVTQGPQGSYGYDARGFRVTAPGGTVVEYTVAGLPHLIQRDADELTFQYDAFNARVRKMRSNGEYSVTVGAGLYEKQVERLRTRHLFSITAEGLPIARVTLSRRDAGRPFTQEIAYVHRDPLGSVETLSDQQGALVARMKFDPFGRRVFPQALATAQSPVVGKALREGFTGHSHDDELGLIDMKGRIYDPSVGRFLTPDPFVQAPSRSQSHNRYAYAWNNPLRYTDPSGLMNEGGCSGTPEDGECWENIAVGGDGGGQSSDSTIYGSYFGWQSDTWYATGPDGRRRGPGRVPGSVTAGEIEQMTAEARRAFFQAESTGGQVPVNFGTDELDAAVDQGSDQFLLGMGGILSVVSLASATGISEVAPAAVARAAVKATVAGSGVAVASGTGPHAPMVVVRIIKKGEKIADIVNESKALTFTSGNEHALVRLATGERALVSGGPGGITFAPGQVTRIFGHTHPTSAPPSSADFEALRRLGQSQQTVYHGGQATKIRP
ncbi:RHS repeat domain-containing protein [Corallococcus sp. AB038B]|uniref:RHS repeat domain-containing protein n=1 Tax=Corallococcus sp. AB038B TaxID=2316718 RepID=UPI000EF6DB71|nr:RHS repeat-associated core domain-containing protein [Corallococcus sp. AB038B]